MNNRKSVIGRIVAIVLIAATCITFFVIGFFGYKTKYGEYEKIDINSPYTMIYDTDMGDALEFVFKLSDNTVEMTDAELDAAKEVVCKRLEYVGAAHYSVTVDYVNQRLRVLVPYASWAVSDWFSQNVCAKGLIYVSSGSEDTGAYIFTNENIRAVKIAVDSAYSGYVSYSISLTLDSGGRRALRMATESLAETYLRTDETGYVTMWLDGESQVSKQIKEQAYTSGTISFSTSYGLDTNAMNTLGMFLASGPMPYGMEYETVTIALMPDMGENPITTMAIALLCAFAAIFIFVIIRYGLIGFSGLLGTLAASGVTIFALSGGFTGQGIPVTIATFSAFVFTLLLSLESILRSGSAIKTALHTGSLLDRAISQGFRATVWPTVRIYLVTVALSVIALLCGVSGPVPWLLRMLDLPFTGLVQIHHAGLVLITGLLSGLAFSYFLPYLFLRLFASLIHKPQLFGGKINE